jgi:hypothetical protein
MGKLAVVLAAALLGACASGSQVTRGGESGFLRDYSVLQQVQDAQGRTIRAWVSPKLTPERYNALLLDPLVFYPEPRPSVQVSAESLQEILTYSNEVFRRSLSERFKIVNSAGTGVVRIRVAFTGVAAQGEGLRPYQMVPAAFVATMAARSMMGTPQRAFIVVESEATDSVTGELLALRIRVATGDRLAPLAGQKVITLQAIKPLLDEMAADVYPNLGQYVRTK